MAPWPSESAPVDAEALEHFEVLQSVVRGVRNARAEYGVTPGKRVAATVVVPGDTALRYEYSPCRGVSRRAVMQQTVLETHGVASGKLSTCQASSACRHLLCVLCCNPPTFESLAGSDGVHASGL